MCITYRTEDSARQTDGRTDRQAGCKPKFPFGFAGRGLISHTYRASQKRVLLTLRRIVPDRLTD